MISLSKHQAETIGELVHIHNSDIEIYDLHDDLSRIGVKLIVPKKYYEIDIDGMTEEIK